MAVAQTDLKVPDVAPVDSLIEIYLLQFAEPVHFASPELARVDKGVSCLLEHLKRTVPMVKAFVKVADVVFLVGMRVDNLTVTLVVTIVC